MPFSPSFRFTFKKTNFLVYFSQGELTSICGKCPIYWKREEGFRALIRKWQLVERSEHIFPPSQAHIVPRVFCHPDAHADCTGWPHG